MEKRALVVVHLLAAGVLLISSHFWLIALVVGSWFYYRHRRRAGFGDLLLGVQGDFVWLERPGNKRQHYKLGRRHFISDYLVVLELKPDNSRFPGSLYLTVFYDSLDADLFRRLRVILCLKRSARTANSLASE